MLSPIGRRCFEAGAELAPVQHHARDRRYISSQLRQMSQLIAVTPSRSTVDAQAACVDAPVSSRAAEDFCGVLATLRDFIHGDHFHRWTLPMNGGPQSQCGPMKKAGLATGELQKAFPLICPAER